MEIEQNDETWKVIRETDLRKKIEKAMSLAYARELEEALKQLTPDQIDSNLLEAQLAYRDLVKGNRETNYHPASHDWEAHLLEYGSLFFTDDPYDPPNGYTYVMALGFSDYRRRWESARTPLGRVLNRVWDEAARLGFIDNADAVEELRRKVVEEITAIGARSIVKAITEPELQEEQLPILKSPVVNLQVTSDLQYSIEDVRAEAYGKPIKNLRRSDLIPILNVNELPELCNVIHIMRLMRRTRAAIYNAYSRMTNLELKRGVRGVALGEWVVPKAIDDKSRHKTWSKSEVIRWKDERERWKQTPKVKGKKP